MWDGRLMVCVRVGPDKASLGSRTVSSRSSKLPCGHFWVREKALPLDNSMAWDCGLQSLCWPT
eukprot:1583060-Rhodomonas_salina.7